MNDSRSAGRNPVRRSVARRLTTLAFALAATACVAPAWAQTTWTVQSNYFAERNAVAQPRTVRSLALSKDDASVYTGYIQSPNVATQIVRKVSSDVLAVTGQDTVIFGNGAGPGGTGGLGPVGTNPIYAAAGPPGFEAWLGVSAGQPRGLATDDRGNVYVSLRAGEVRIYDSALSPAQLGAFAPEGPLGVDVVKLGGTYFAYVVGTHSITRWDVTDVAFPVLDAGWVPPLDLVPPGTPLPLSSAFTEGNGITVDADGTVFVAAFATNRVYRISADGLTVISSGVINAPADVAVYQEKLYVVSRISPVPPIVQLFKDTLGSSGPGIVVPDFGTTRSSIAQLTAIEVSSDGKLYVSEENYLGTANGIPSYTPPATSFNPTPTAITGRIYFDRVVVSDAIPTNVPPVVTSPDVVDQGTVEVKVGQTLDMSFLATDQEGSAMELTATGLPAGATLTPNSGTTSASPFATDLSFAPVASDFGTSYSVTLSYKDNADKIGTISFTIEVPVNSVPTVSTPSAVTVECTGGQNLVTLEADVDDADDHPLTITWSVNGIVEEVDNVATPPGTVDFEFDYQDGVNTVEVAVSDSYDTTTVSTTVTVQDTTDPVIIVAADVIVPTDPGEDFATNVVLTEPQVFDLCDGDPTLTNDAPLVYPLGETIVTWTATDADGNEATGTQKVTVVDQEAPQISGDTEIVVTVDNGEVFATPNLRRPDVSDNVPGKITLTNDAPAQFPIGRTRVIWTATDLAGNEATLNLFVIVVNNKPVAAAGKDRTVETFSKKGRELTLNGKGSIDPDRQDLTFLWSAPGVTFDDPTSTNPTALFPVGQTIVTLIVTDEAGATDRDRVRIRVLKSKKLVIDRRLYGPGIEPYVEETIWRVQGLADTLPSNAWFSSAVDYAELADDYENAAGSIEYVDAEDFPHRLGLYLSLRYYQALYDQTAADYIQYGYFYSPDSVESVYDYYLAAYTAAATAAQMGYADYNGVE